MSNIFVKSFKAVTRMLHGGGSFFGLSVGGQGRVNYKREVGSLLDASVVMAPVQWVQRALPEARLVVKSRKRDGSIDMIDDHPMLMLIQTPNPFYADIVLWWGIILSMLTDGNAYLIIVRNGFNQPAELWYIPHWMMEPKWDHKGDEYISYYEYSPGGGTPPQKIASEDVVHFRHGINPRNLRKGIAPLDSAIREIFMDNESSAFVSALLKNMGVPGVVISPKGGAMVPQGDAEATKAWFQQQFGGDNRGKPLVMGAPTDVTPYGFNPQQMNMSESRDVAEERVCALLGIPAAVVGFGSGLQSTKVGATMEEMRKLAWHNGVLPIARLIADELQRSLLPLFPKTQGQIVDWDTDDVRALQEDEDKKTERWNKRLAGGAVTIAEAREAWGLDVDDSHRIYLRPFSVIEVPEGETRPEPAALPSPKSRGAKSGRVSDQAYKSGAAFVRGIQAQERSLQKVIEGPLKKLFTDMGDAAAKAAKGEIKSAKEDDAAVVEQILSKLGIAGWQSKLKQIYAAHYEEAMNATAKVAADAGLGVSVPDEVMRSVIAAGGRRSAMVDLTEQTKAAIFEALAEGRAEGEGVEALAKRILGHVEGGPWGTADTRARVIARTETKYAQNISTIERARAGGVDMFIVFDGRLGPGRSKPDHIARDGSIVTAAEADEMAEAEHPNGTLSFAPYFEGME
jgi:HK97 family phage portal protein